MELLQVGLALVGVLGLIFMLMYALKKFNKRVSTTSENKMKVIDRINLGRDGMLLVISAGGKIMLIGATPNNISLLAELPGSEEDYVGNSGNNNSAASEFKNVLDNILHGNKKDSGNNHNEK